MSRMETIYRTTIIAAAVLAATSALAGALVLSGVLVPATGDPPDILIVAIVIILLFLALNLGLRFMLSERLPFPFPAGLQRMAALTTVVIWIAITGYGVLRWADAPVRGTGTGFIDKAGRQYSREEFISFKRWETAFILFFIPVCLVALTKLPGQQLHPGAAKQ